MTFNPNEHQHLRYNPLKDEWVLVSPHRALRPWSGQTETPAAETVPRFDPNNPLCPGATRASGIVTPNYESTYVFTNDFPALLEEGPEPEESEDPLFQTKSAKGTCKVMCYHPYSNVYLTSLSTKEVVDIINEWVRQTSELGKKYLWVQLFENRGQMMGCSNPHPHCQIWSSSFLPNEARVKNLNLKNYYQKYQRAMLQDYVEKEIKLDERIVTQNEEWAVVVPYWAVWPFETMVLPKRQIERFIDANGCQREALAKILQVLVAKYDNLFKCNFPYSMGWHGAPTGPELNQLHPHWTFHGIYLPPLLRSATVKKFMVGYELLAQAQRDLTPEKAASMLRQQENVRFQYGSWTPLLFNKINNNTTQPAFYTWFPESTQKDYRYILRVRFEKGSLRETEDWTTVTQGRKIFEVLQISCKIVTDTTTITDTFGDYVYYTHANTCHNFSCGILLVKLLYNIGKSQCTLWFNK